MPALHSLVSGPAVPALLGLAALLIVLFAVRRGWRAGGISVLTRLAGGLAGLAVGGVVGAVIVVRAFAADAASVAHLALGAGCALAGTVLGAVLGGRLGAFVARLLPRLVDRVVGVVVRGGLAVVVCAVVLGALAAAGIVQRTVPAGTRPLTRAVTAGAGDLVTRATHSGVTALVPTSLR